MEYNLGGIRSGTLIGNWAENRSLESRGEKARVTGKEGQSVNTQERVLPKSQHAVGGWESEASATAKQISQKAPTAQLLAPRERLQRALVERQAEAYATTLLTRAPEELPVSPLSMAASAYTPYPASAYTVPLRRAASDAAPPPELGATRSGGVASSEDLSAAAPVTYYTARLMDGVFPKGPIKNAANPFARSFAFSNPIEASYVRRGSSHGGSWLVAGFVIRCSARSRMHCVLPFACLARPRFELCESKW